VHEAVAAVGSVSWKEDPEGGKVDLGVSFESGATVDDGKWDDELRFHRYRIENWKVTEEASGK
jgi:hypothetical protein